MLFFHAAAACCGQARIAFTQVQVDAGDEDHHQRGVEHKAHQQPDHVKARQALVQVLRQLQGQVVCGQHAKTQQRDDHDGPDVGAAQQHGPQRDLQQVQEDERIAGAPAQVQLHCEHGHIDQQGQKKLHIAHHHTGAQPQQAHHVEHRQAAHHQQHLAHRQREVQAVVRHLDGEHLADHGNPAQLDQLLQVLDACGGIGRACVALRRGGRSIRTKRCHQGRRWWQGAQSRAGGARSVPHTSQHPQP
ncbi:hypothetical protein D3C71_1277850 [compost metagenome]